MDSQLHAVAERLGARLKGRALSLAAAESCTGGWVAKALTDVAGCSAWFDRGFVTYTNTAKIEMLGVDTAILERAGAVSEETVRAMAEGALARSHADLAVAISGVAGPSGGTPEKPVGTVWFAWGRAATDGPAVITRHCRFGGDREAVRRASVLEALRGIEQWLD